MCTFCKSRQELSNPNSNEYLLTCKSWHRYSRERASHFFVEISTEFAILRESKIVTGSHCMLNCFPEM